MDRYVCIHGHFYQPPRESPWLESIELQESAYPYHDWNERILAECYAPNAFSRILDGDGQILRLVNNYARISFNFGPTLLSWLEAHAPDTYAAIREADRQSRQTFSGHGSALAQVYNHVIMPLANRRDKLTQIRWGLADFAHRFGRPAEGMWLAETAVDLETLDLLAQHGVQFTILSPYQAARVRPLGAAEWQDARHGKVDPTRPYLVALPSGHVISVFFYDGPIAQAIAFDGVLQKGEYLAERLLGAFRDEDVPQLVHIATDGETYGHHRRFGDMALAYALALIEERGPARLTVYGEYLEKFPPQDEAEILERSAWSCGHGVGRWERDCGCRSGGHPGWSQQWRGPLRAAFDWLRDTLAPAWEAKARDYFHDPWAARDKYVRVILDRSGPSRARLYAGHVLRTVAHEDEVTMLKLLEMQRHLLLMYTSCGWFFDEVSGIETVQVIQYAGRAVQLAREVLGLGLEEELLARLAQAKSNVPAVGTGRGVYEKFVRPAVVDLPKVAAHFAVSSLFEEYPEPAKVYCYTLHTADCDRAEVSRARLAVGRVRVVSDLTLEARELVYGAVHFGDHNLNGGIRPYQSPADYDALQRELHEEFARIDFPAVIVTLEQHLQASAYSLRSLFRDQQRKVLGQITESSARGIDDSFRKIYEEYGLVMRFLLGLDAPLPSSFSAAAEYILNRDLLTAFREAELDRPRILELLADVETFRVKLDAAGLSFALTRSLDRQVERVRRQPEDLEALRDFAELVSWARALPFEVDFWSAQNFLYARTQSALPDHEARATLGDIEAAEWLKAFAALGTQLRVKLPERRPALRIVTRP